MAIQKCPTAVRMATVAITNSHKVVVAVSFETAANPVHISYCILYVLLLCKVIKHQNHCFECKYILRTYVVITGARTCYLHTVNNRS